jgi:hypothetical protein
MSTELQSLEPGNGRIETAPQCAETRETAEGYPHTPAWPIAQYSVAATQIWPIVERLETYMAFRGFGPERLGKALNIKNGMIHAYLKGRFPAQEHWPALIRKHIATEAELLAWRPQGDRDPKAAPPASWFIRQARVYSLGVMAGALHAAAVIALVAQASCLPAISPGAGEGARHSLHEPRTTNHEPLFEGGAVWER